MKKDFIPQIAAYVQKYAPQYGIAVHSPIIAQAVLESAGGTSVKAIAGHNYFGLKWRANRVPIAIGKFKDYSQEDRGDHNETIVDEWFRFANMEDGVHGYFQFINIKNYSALKGETDPRKYLEKIKAAGYATDKNYVSKVMNVINKYDLTQYDKKEGNKMKVFLSAGHGGSDPGAVAYGLKEKDINLQALLACKEVLEAHGVDVVCSRTTDANDPVREEVKEANASGADLVFSIHTNASGGDGWEAFCNPNNANGMRLAKLCEKYVKALGQNSRGIKSGMKLFFVKNTSATAVLCENFFIDNDLDNNIGDTVAEQRAFGVAYAQAILEYLGIKYKASGAGSASKPETPTKADSGARLVRITASVLNVRAGAGMGYKVNTTVKRGEVFTITETSGEWGKLKSGAGWISLKYTENV